MATGLLLLRVVVGLALVGHGTQKLFGWFGGHGPRTTGTFFEMLGYRPGVLFAVVAGLSEDRFHGERSAPLAAAVEVHLPTGTDLHV